MQPTLLLTTLATLTFFAANSVLCRLAIVTESIDPASFTSFCLISGAVMLWLLLRLTGKKRTMSQSGSWRGAAMLFLYAVTLSFAYISLDTGMGALILFGAVQITMIITSLLRGHKPVALEWTGLLLAFAGLAYLLLPGATAPSWIGFLLWLSFYSDQVNL